MLTLASTEGRWLLHIKHTQRKTMNYTINEVSNQLINPADHDHLSFFYKFELKPKEEFASIEDAVNAYALFDRKAIGANCPDLPIDKFR